MNAQDIVDYVFEIAPNPSTAWENEFLYGDGLMEVTGVAVSWWITLDILEDMVRRGLTFGLSHERVLWELPERFVWGPLPDKDEIRTNQRESPISARSSSLS